MIELKLNNDEHTSIDKTKEYVLSIDEQSDAIIVKHRKNKICIHLADISYFQMENRRLCVYTKQGKRYSVWKKLRELKKEIERKDSAFLQVHSGCVINIRHIKAFKNGEILMDGKESVKIPVSRRRQKEVRSSVSMYRRGHS